MEIKNEIQHKMLVDKVVAQSYSLLSTFYYLIILILLSITIGSCYTIVSDCVDPVPLPAEPGITINPNPLDFGDVGVNFPSSKNITIQNSGTADLVISQATINGTGFTLSGVITPITITAGGSRTITVRFLPTVVGAHSGSVILTHNATGSPDTVQLTGNGSSADGFWERTNSPQYAYPIAVTNNGDIWVKFSIPAGIYLSTDNGDTWVQKNSVSTDLPIAVSPVNGYIFTGIRNQGLLRSTDNGESWVQVISSTSSTNIFSILITPSNEIYLGTGGDIYYSTDNGDTWIEKRNGLPSSQYQIVNSLALGRDGTLYVGIGNSGVYRSTNKGDTWLPPSNYFGAYVHRIAISDDGSIFATASGDGILKSTDKGVTWTQVYNNGSADRIIYNPITNDIFIIDNSNMPVIYRSTDLGKSWKLTHTGIPNGITIYEFAVNPNTGQLYATTADGVYRSRNYP